MMNDPIDILEIAIRRYDKALDWWRSTWQMNASTSAAVSHAYAQSMLDAARDDLWRARQMSHDVALMGC